MLVMLTISVSVLFLLEFNMIDVNSLDKIFVDDVMYLFDQNIDMGTIAEMLECEFEVVDAIVCQSISTDTTELL